MIKNKLKENTEGQINRMLIVKDVPHLSLGVEIR